MFGPATGDGLRFDSGVRSGDTVTPHYDPMLAKVIAWGQNRDEARRRLLRALEDTTIFGVTTNRYFLGRIIGHDSFGAGEATTAFLQQAFREDPSLAPTRSPCGSWHWRPPLPAMADRARMAGATPPPPPPR